MCRLTPAKCLAQYLAHPKHFYCLCVFDALPYHPQVLNQSHRGVFGANSKYLFSCGFSCGHLAGSVWECWKVRWLLCGDQQHLLMGEKLSMLPGMCSTHKFSQKWRRSWAPSFVEADTLPFSLLCLFGAGAAKTTWFDMWLLVYNGFPSRVPAGISAIVPGGEGKPVAKR